MIAMIEAPFRAPAMSLTRGTDRRATRRRTTRRRAIRMTAITRLADREEPVAASADFLAKWRVHDVGAATRSDWTRRSNRGTRGTTGSVRRSIEAVTEGLEGSAPGPHLIRRRAQLTPRARDRSNPKRPWTLTQPWTHRTRPPLLGNLAEEREIPTSAHSHSLSFRRTKTKNNDPTLVQIYAVSDER
jgi:hypothetical protein